MQAFLGSLTWEHQTMMLGNQMAGLRRWLSGGRDASAIVIMSLT